MIFEIIVLVIEENIKIKIFKTINDFKALEQRILKEYSTKNQNNKNNSLEIPEPP